ncbi:Six-hairpin glycosidase [Epithele typhae]|uniref:Six-hairpin glycosidase n=1 Tax=Epithele typhae TaxID=378194 RepID=UPI0020088CC5|nr:Six-hairpin glycosidase [Epithele typhae]KAH9943362.1 Six-hairpin glycosidase [Epithele typhae]
MRSSRSLFFALCALPAVFSAPAEPTGLDDAMIAKVKANLRVIATHSWEIGTELETLTELEWPSLAVFEGTLPPPTTLKSGEAADVIDYAAAIVANITGDGPLIDGDGAVGDPASIGQARRIVLLAAANQLNYLLNVAPHTDDGAISHRAEQVQLWADFVYMAPPFIAYYGALQGGDEGLSLLKESYTQCKLYRKYLQDNGTLWRHITLGSWSDKNHWGTGNAWAAAGMLRVLETLARSEFSSSLTQEQVDLTSWVNEILTSVWALQQSNGTLLNYLDQPATSFGDTSSTALLAASSYRYATITGDLTHIPAANRAFDLIKASLTDDGWLLNTVDPESFSTPSPPGVYSPEGQSFVLLLHTAWRAFKAATSL